MSTAPTQLASSLTESDLTKLERDSWIDPATAEAWGLRRVNSLDGAQLVGRTDHADYSGIVFPVYWPGDSKPKEYFLRRDHPDYEQRNGQLKPKQKYLAPPGRGNRLLFGPSESAESLTDISLPIVLVEGLKKTVAAHRLSRWQSETPRFLACGLSGAWNFRGTIGKTTDANGARVSITGIIPDFDRIERTDRLVLLIYDSDSATKSSVSAAREALAEILREQGARVVIMFLPSLDGLEQTGFDDLLARWGPQAVLDWLQTAQTGAAEIQDDPAPILLDVVTVPPFPTNLIPAPWLRAMIEATAAATEAPIELPLLLGLGVIATCVQQKYVVEPERGYVEPLNLWAIPALPSGERKTENVRKMTAPLLAFERDYALAHTASITAAEAERRLADDRLKHLRQKAARAEGAEYTSLRHELLEAEAALPTVPILPRLWCQDVTVEKLGQLMADHHERMAIISDEGGLFDILAGRYNSGMPNLDLCLQAYSGTPYRVDRGSRPSVFMERPALTLVLSP